MCIFALSEWKSGESWIQISRLDFSSFLMYSILIGEVFAKTQPLLDIIWCSLTVQDLNIGLTDSFIKDTTELQFLVLLCILTACVSMCVLVGFPCTSVSVSTVTFYEWQCKIEYRGMESKKKNIAWTREDRPSVVLPLFLELAAVWF